MNETDENTSVLSGIRLIFLLVGLVAVVWGFHFQPNHFWAWLVFTLGILIVLCVAVPWIVNRVVLHTKR